MSQGVVVVAAQGNENIDLSKQNVDTISPDNVPEPLTREVTNACLVIPMRLRSGEASRPTGTCCRSLTTPPTGLASRMSWRRAGTAASS